MKKLFLMLLSALSLFGYRAEAQTSSSDDILTAIQSSGSRASVIDKKFTEVRTSPDGQSVTLTGQLVYNPDSYLSMTYDNGELFLIDGLKMTINRDGRNQTFDLTKNLMMKNLSHALLYSFRGALEDLAVEQKATVGTEKNGGDYVVTLKATKPSPRGYSRIEVYYDAETYEIKAMTMDEFTRASTHYSM